MLIGLHDVYALAGRPSYQVIARGIKSDDQAPATLNHQAIGKILKGKKLPDPRQLVSLVTWLFREGSVSGQSEGDVNKLLPELLRFREMAHRGELEIRDEASTASSEERRDGKAGISPVIKRGVDGERKLLSCMLQSKDAIADVVELVKSDVFADELHLQTYAVLLQLYADGNEITLDSAVQSLKGRISTPIDVREYIGDLLLEVSDPGEAELHAERLIDFAKLRRIAEMGERFTELAEQSSAGDKAPDADSLVALVEGEVISFINEIAKLSTVSSVLEDALYEVEAAGTKGANRSVPSGFGDFDALNSGFRPGELVLIAGASGIGKSTLGLDFVRACSIGNSRTSYLVSLQMSRQEMAMRIMAAEARVPLDRMRSGTMTDDEWTRLAQVMPAVNDAPIFMQDEAAYTLAELTASCRRLSSLSDLQLVVIDSLDLLYVDRDSVDPDRDLVIMARELRNMAKELNLPVVAFLQTEHPPMRVYDRQPELRDVPGSLERLADVVILLHRPDAYERESLRAGEADLIVAKNRSGPSAKITVAFQGHYARFVDLNR
ncbi:replicative DNA helicase [Streptomyces sp. NPDC056405]|uniref:replicative DNA helicase n=1 Tax=Streptomyces sp. NPDC056405 TaxID=3345811 RepID=UPI0035D8018D